MLHLPQQSIILFYVYGFWMILIVNINQVITVMVKYCFLWDTDWILKFDFNELRLQYL